MTQAGKDSPETNKWFLSPPGKVSQGNASFVDHFLLFMFRVYCVFLTVYCNLVVACWETADLLAV